MIVQGRLVNFYEIVPGNLVIRQSIKVRAITAGCSYIVCYQSVTGKFIRNILYFLIFIKLHLKICLSVETLFPNYKIVSMLSIQYRLKGWVYTHLFLFLSTSDTILDPVATSHQ